jgi:phage-related protein
MAANTVESTVKVNITADADNVKQVVDEIKSELNSIGKVSVDPLSGITDSAEITKESFQGMFDELSNSKNVFVDLEGEAGFLIDEFGNYAGELYTIADALKNLEENGSVFKNIDDDINDTINKTYTFADAIKNLEENGSVFKDTGETSSATNEIDSLTKANEKASDSQSKFAENSDLVKKALKEIVTTGHLSEATLEKLITTLGADSVAILALAAAVVALKKVWNECSKAVDEFNDTALKFGEGAITGIADAFEGAVTGGVDLFIDAIGELIDVCEKSFDTLQQFAEYGTEVEDAYFKMAQTLGSNATSSINDFVNQYSELYGLDATGLISSMSGIVSSVKNLSSNSEELATATSSLTTVANNLSIFAGSFEDAANDIGNAIRQGNVSRSSSLYSVLTKDQIAELKALDTELERYNYIIEHSADIMNVYNQYLETDSGKVALLQQQYSRLTGNIGQLALKLYGTVAPVLTKLLELINTVLEQFMKLFNIDYSDTGDIEGFSSALGDVADSLSNTGDAAEEATRQTASFDDVIQISDSSTDSLSGMDTSAVSSALDGILDMEDKARTEWDDLIDKIKEDIDNEDWGALGTDITDFFADKLSSIDWNKINKNFEKAGKGIASFINSVSANRKFWAVLGTTIGNSFNAINTGIYNFLKNFDGKTFGLSIGNLFKSMFDNIDTDLAGDTLYEALNSITDIIDGWLVEGGLESAFNAITETLQRLFKDIADSGKAGDYAQTLYNFVKNIWDSLYTSIVTLLNDDNVRSSFKGFVSTIFQNLAADSGDFADDIINLVVSILSFIGETLINEENINNMITAISNFISGIADRKDDIVAALKPIVTALSNGLKELIESGDIEKAFNTIYDVLKESDVFDLIAEFVRLQIKLKWEALLLNIKEKLSTFGNFLWENIGGALKQVFTLITALLTAYFVETEYTAATFWSGLIKKVKGWFTGLGENLGTWIDGLWTKISSGLKSIWTKFKTWWNDNIASISFDVDIPDWIPGVGGKEWSIGIPKLATGGIATKSTIANIGEAGKEAILPLENNTGWMDTLATKIASKIQSPNTSGTGSVTIDMSKLTKAVYTRSELYDLGEVVAKSLNVYGYNVTLVK